VVRLSTIADPDRSLGERHLVLFRTAPETEYPLVDDVHRCAAWLLSDLTTMTESIAKIYLAGMLGKPKSSYRLHRCFGECVENCAFSSTTRYYPENFRFLEFLIYGNIPHQIPSS